MIRYFLSVFLFITLSNSVFTQDTLILHGKYYEKNIYILNPSNEIDTSFCVKKVLINDQPSKDELNSNSFEIDFSLLNIPVESALKIFIIYAKGCTPKILNPEVLQNQTTLSFVSSKVEKGGKLVWLVTGDPKGSFSIEQFRWKKWTNVGSVNFSDTIKKNTYSFDVKAHFGQNIFQITYTDSHGNEVSTKPIKYRVSTIKEIFLSSQKVNEEIIFSEETAYEIFDDKGNFIMEGFGKKVSINELQKGKYWVNYDNKTEIVTKK